MGQNICPTRAYPNTDQWQAVPKDRTPLTTHAPSWARIARLATDDAIISHRIAIVAAKRAAWGRRGTILRNNLWVKEYREENYTPTWSTGTIKKWKRKQ